MGWFLNILRFVVCWCLVLASLHTQAARFKESWNPVEGASAYEYQISKESDFSEKNIVEKGRTQSTDIDIDLEAGVYFFRLRAVAKEGVGNWTPPLRKTLVESSIKVSKPQDSSKIPLLSMATEVSIEWKGLGKKVDDYSILLESAGGKRLFLYSTRENIEVPNLSAGEWSIKVSGRKKGVALYESAPIKVELLDASNFTPRIVSPLDGEKIPEFSEFDLHWTRKLPGKKSEIFIARADHPGFPIIIRENHYSKSSTIIKGLSKGRYQLTVRDFESAEKESTEQTITLIVVDNPRDLQPENLGISARFMSGTFFGYRSVTTPSMLGKAAHYNTIGGYQLESRVTWKFSSGWGGEGQLGSSAVGYQFRDTNFNQGANYQHPTLGTQPLTEASVFNPLKLAPTDAFLRLGVLRKWPLKNQNLDLWLKAHLHYRYLRAPLFDLASFNENTTPTLRPSYTMTNYGQVGFALGAELKWRLKPWTELCAEGTLPLPFLAESGPSTEFGKIRAGSGGFSEFYLPELRLEIFIRRKILREFRVLAGAISQIGFTSVREKAIEGILDEAPSGRRTRTTEFSLSPRVGVDWEF